jgi:hypothetical protein
MKKALFIALSLCFSTCFGQVEKPLRIQVYAGGPSLMKMAFKISSKYQDEFAFSGSPGFGVSMDYKLKSWISVGAEFNYRYGQIDFDISDSAFYQVINDRFDIVNTVFDPFGHYTLKLPRYRFMANVNFHFLKEYSASDLYLSLGLGINRLKPQLYLNDQSLVILNRYIGFISLPVAYRISLGYSYHFIPSVGIFGELGVGGPIFSGGITARF